MENPAEAGEFRVFNQFTESFSVLELAQRVDALRPAGIDFLDNPRVEKEQHHYRAANDGLLRLGLEPHLLTDAELLAMLAVADGTATGSTPAVIAPLARWRRAAPTRPGRTARTCSPSADRAQ